VKLFAGFSVKPAIKLGLRKLEDAVDEALAHSQGVFDWLIRLVLPAVPLPERVGDREHHNETKLDQDPPLLHKGMIFEPIPAYAGENVLKDI
jgi:hypothetical protein